MLTLVQHFPPDDRLISQLANSHTMMQSIDVVVVLINIGKSPVVHKERVFFDHANNSSPIVVPIVVKVLGTKQRAFF